MRISDWSSDVCSSDFGPRWLPEPDTRADTGELLRTIGFAISPGILRVLGVVPVLGALVFIVTAFWSLIAVVIAAPQELDYSSTGRAIGDRTSVVLGKLGHGRVDLGGRSSIKKI